MGNAHREKFQFIPFQEVLVEGTYTITLWGDIREQEVGYGS